MNGKLKSLSAFLILLSAWLPLSPLRAEGVLAASGSGDAIGFEDETLLEVVWASPIEFVVLNNTTLDLQVQLAVGAFEPEQAGGSASEPLDLVQVPDAVFALPATARKPLSVNFNTQMQPAPGIYNGWITLSTGQPPTVIRKNVRLSVPLAQVEGLRSAQTPLGSAPPAVSAWTLQAFRLFPGMRPVCFRNLSTNCALPLQVMNPPATARAGYIGTLNGDNGGGLAVAFRAARRNQALLTLEFGQLWSPVGAYSGTLDFLPDDAGAGEVALTVNVKDVFLIPVGVVVLGILLAQWVQFYLSVRRGVMEVERRLAQVIVDFAAVPNEVISGYSVKNDVQVQHQAIIDALADWSSQRAMKPSEEDTARFKAMVLDPLDKLEEDIQAWAAFDAHLEVLRKTLDNQAWPVIEKTRAPAHLNLDAPRFYIVARSLLRGRAISLRDFSQRQDVIDEAIEFAELWGNLDNTRATVGEALDFVNQYKFQLSDKAQQDLELARRKLSEAHRELWEAENLTRLRVLRTTDDLEDAKTILNQLMGLIEVGPARPEELVPEGIELVGPWSAEGGTFLGSFDMSVLRNLRARLWSVIPPSLKPAAPDSPERARRRILWLDRALLAGDLTLVGLAFLTAVIAGLKPYFTTNFGTFYDYLSAFTWGFAAKAAVELVNAVLEKFLGSENT